MVDMLRSCYNQSIMADGIIGSLCRAEQAANRLPVFYFVDSFLDGRDKLFVANHNKQIGESLDN